MDQDKYWRKDIQYRMYGIIVALCALIFTPGIVILWNKVSTVDKKGPTDTLLKHRPDPKDINPKPNTPPYIPPHNEPCPLPVRSDWQQYPPPYFNLEAFEIDQMKMHNGITTIQ